MILVDTSIWIDHLRVGDADLTALLLEQRVLAHPAVIGELAVGSLARRNEVLALLHGLPQAVPATDAEVLALIETRRLFGLGIGFIDAHLLAAALLTPGATVWTRDRRLATAAAGLDLTAR